MSENEVLDFDIPIAAVDGKRLTVLTRSTEVRKGSTTDFKTYVKAAPTLDEITNKVFEEVLQGKSDIVGKSDQGSTKSEEWGSEHSSGIFGKFLRRDSAFHEKSRSKSRGTGKQILEGASKHVEGVVSMVTGKPPLIGKWKPTTKIPGKSESDELYEGLKRAQRSRLEDQRGTEINFELPDFLKVSIRGQKMFAKNPFYSLKQAYYFQIKFFNSDLAVNYFVIFPAYKYAIFFTGQRRCLSKR